MFCLSNQKNFLWAQKWVRISHGERAMGVWFIVQFYCIYIYCVLLVNSFCAKFQTINVVCFLFFVVFFNKLLIGRKFICKVVKLKDWLSNSIDDYEPSHLDLRCLQKHIIIACGSERVKQVLLMSTHNLCFYGEIRKIILEFHDHQIFHNSFLTSPLINAAWSVSSLPTVWIHQSLSTVQTAQIWRLACAVGICKWHVEFIVTSLKT